MKINKKLITGACVLFVLVLSATWYFFLRERIYVGEVDVIMNEKGFDKEEIVIKKGTRVNFINKDSGARWPASDLHPSHGIFPEFDPQRPLKSGEVWSFVFEKVGTWGMHDHISPYYTGEIKVID